MTTTKNDAVELNTRMTQLTNKTTHFGIPICIIKQFTRMFISRQLGRSNCRDEMLGLVLTAEGKVGDLAHNFVDR